MPSQERYLKLTAEAKSRIREVTVEQIEKSPLDPRTILIDVREADEWKKSHAVGALHLPRGILESEIEEKVPDLAAPVVVYCAGGNRSALVAENLQRMGYSNVASLAGGFRAWEKARLPVMPAVAAPVVPRVSVAG